MIDHAEHWIETPPGRLYSKTWIPRNNSGAAPILLFHDSLGCVALWRDFPALLSAALGRTIVAYDRLGFGRSDANRHAPTQDFIAAEAELVVPLLCEQLDISNFVACGHSVGGGMAVETGASFPGRCEAVITIAAQAFVEARTLEGIRTARQEFRSPDNFARLVKYHGDKAQWVLSAWLDTWLSPQFAGWSLDPALGRLQCPGAAIHGDNDEDGSVEHPKRIAGDVGAVRILEGIGHTPHRECPDLLVKTIGDLLRP